MGEVGEPHGVFGGGDCFTPQFPWQRLTPGLVLDKMCEETSVTQNNNDKHQTKKKYDDFVLFLNEICSMIRAISHPCSMASEVTHRPERDEEDFLSFLMGVSVSCVGAS